MAVESQPPPVQPASPGLTMSRDFIQVIGAAAALAAVIIAGMALVVSITVAPVREEMRLLREDIRSLHTAMQRGFEAVDSEFKAVRGEMGSLQQGMNDEFKAVRGEMSSVRGEVGGLRQDMNDGFKAVRGEMSNLRQDMNDELKAIRSDMADLRERLTRMETLLERDTAGTDAPVEQP